MAPSACSSSLGSTTRPLGLIRCIPVTFLLSPSFRLGSGAGSVSWLPPPADSVPPNQSPIQPYASTRVIYSSVPVVESAAQLHQIAGVENQNNTKSDVSTRSAPSLPSARGAFAAPPSWHSKRPIMPVTNTSQQQSSFLSKLLDFQTRTYPIPQLPPFQEGSLPGFLSIHTTGYGRGSIAPNSTANLCLDLTYENGGIQGVVKMS